MEREELSKEEEELINQILSIPNVKRAQLEDSGTYAEKKGSWSVFVGCRHACVYCEPSYQQQCKRRWSPDPEKRKNIRDPCEKCYTYEPHAHRDKFEKEELDKLPETKDDKFIWVAPCSDLVFAHDEDKKLIPHIIDTVKQFPSKTFLIQTKDPQKLYIDVPMELYGRTDIWPENLILDITLETNKNTLDSKTAYQYNPRVSYAPNPSMRYQAYTNVNHTRKFLTIEPILDFGVDEFVEMIRTLKPERVYIGYESQGTADIYNFPEPPLKKTKKLIERISKFVPVYVKHLRDSHYIRPPMLVEDGSFTPITVIKRISPYNIRKTEPEAYLNDLVKSMCAIGINDIPIIIDQNYEVVAGGRRYLAALKARLPKLRCIQKHLTPKDATILSLKENIKEDIDKKDKYEAVNFLHLQGMSIRQIAKEIGVPKSTVHEWLRFPMYPETIKDGYKAEETKEDIQLSSKHLTPTLDSEAFQKCPEPDTSIKLHKNNWSKDLKKKKVLILKSHLINLENKEEFVEILDRFLDFYRTKLKDRYLKSYLKKEVAKISLLISISHN